MEPASPRPAWTAQSGSGTEHGKPAGKPLATRGGSGLALNFQPQGNLSPDCGSRRQNEAVAAPESDRASAHASSAGASWTLVRDPWEGSTHRLTPRSFVPTRNGLSPRMPDCSSQEGEQGIGRHVWNVSADRSETPISLHLSDRQPSAETGVAPLGRCRRLQPRRHNDRHGGIRRSGPAVGCKNRPACAGAQEPFIISRVWNGWFSVLIGKMLATESESGPGRI